MPVKVVKKAAAKKASGSNAAAFAHFPTMEKDYVHRCHAAGDSPADVADVLGRDVSRLLATSSGSRSQHTNGRRQSLLDALQL